jgi:hypothetical protein
MREVITALFECLPECLAGIRRRPALLEGGLDVARVCPSSEHLALMAA